MTAVINGITDDRRIAATCDRLRQLTIIVESGDDPAYAGILRESTRDLLSTSTAAQTW
jgi:hypothetical protein